MSGIHLPWAGARQEGQQEGYRQEHRTLGIIFILVYPSNITGRKVRKRDTGRSTEL